MNRRGAVLLLTLMGMVAVALAMLLLHHLALASLQQGRAALAAVRAREAAEVGVARAVAGLGYTGTLPAGAGWIVVVDTLPGGIRLLWSAGRATLPSPATVEIGTMVEDRDTLLVSGPPISQPERWLVMRW